MKLYLAGPIGSGKLHQGGPMTAIYFRDLWPTRAALFDRLFPDVAKQQINLLKGREK